MGSAVAKEDVNSEELYGRMIALLLCGEAQSAANEAKETTLPEQLPQLLRKVVSCPTADASAVDTLAKTFGAHVCAWVDYDKRTTLVYGLEERLPEEKLLALLGNMADDDLLLVAANGWTALPLACEATYEELAVAIVARLPYEELIRQHNTAAYERYGCGFARGNAMQRGEPVARGVALHYAARRGLCRVIEALLARLEPKDVPLLDWVSNTPLAVALIRGHEEVTELLLQDGPLVRICQPYSLATASARSLALIMDRYGDEIVAMPEEEQYGLLSRMIDCRALAQLEIFTPYLSSSVIKMSSPDRYDGRTPAEECEHRHFEAAIPLLQRVGPKSAAA